MRVYSMKVRHPVVALLVGVFVFGFIWVLLANPFNLFVPRSERFSLTRFKAIEPGTSVADAIKLLGKPVKVVKKDRFDPSCPTCIAYCFMGEPPGWVFGFQEAWLIVDHKGKVVQVFLHTEP